MMKSNGTLPDAVGFDFSRLGGREKYKLLIGGVVPRPIAWVTTVDKAGRINAAPFSFFNCLSADPAILALGVEYRPNGQSKDTGRHVHDTQAFTVNIVSGALMDAMNVTAVPFGAGVDELAKAGLHARPGVKVPCPAIAESRVAFECRHHVTLSIGNSREIILGEVVYAHLHASVVNERFHVDPVALDAVGRMGGHGYATTRDYFELPTMTVEEWENGLQQEQGPETVISGG
jgi:flavin reductase (DIM6/NTAB) family NADH-FMN oxidoreductase RutF